MDEKRDIFSIIDEINQHINNLNLIKKSCQARFASPEMIAQIDMRQNKLTNILEKIMKVRAVGESIKQVSRIRSQHLMPLPKHVFEQIQDILAKPLQESSTKLVLPTITNKAIIRRAKQKVGRNGV